MAAALLFARICAALAVVCGALPAAAQSFPTRPVKLVYPFPAGSSSEVVYRAILDQLTKSLGQPVILDAKPGGGSMVASLYVKNQPPDGYTIYAVSNAVTVKSVIPNAQIDIRKDFVPIAPGSKGPLIILVNPDKVKANTIPELIAEARSKPGQLNYGSYGVGSGAHMFMEMLINETKVNIVHVPYQGTGQALQETAAGRVDITASILAQSRAFLADQGGSGKLRLIGESFAERDAILPNVPGMKEAGYPDLDYLLWGGYVAPAGTKREVVNVINQAFNAAYKDPATVELYKRFGLEVMGGSPEDLAKIIDTEYNAYVKLIKDTGLKLE
jgi:tripartite-type tricarboxylate transporter receptor subunit TctC